MTHQFVVNIVVLAGLYLAIWNWFRMLPLMVAFCTIPTIQLPKSEASLWGICSAYIFLYLILWRAGVLLH